MITYRLEKASYEFATSRNLSSENIKDCFLFSTLLIFFATILILIIKACHESQSTVHIFSSKKSMALIQIYKDIDIYGVSWALGYNSQVAYFTCNLHVKGCSHMTSATKGEKGLPPPILADVICEQILRTHTTHYDPLRYIIPQEKN